MPYSTGAADDTRSSGAVYPAATQVPVLRLLGLTAEEFSARFNRPRDDEGELTPSPTCRSRRLKRHAPEFGGESEPARGRLCK